MSAFPWKTFVYLSILFLFLAACLVEELVEQEWARVIGRPTIQRRETEFGQKLYKKEKHDSFASFRQGRI